TQTTKYKCFKRSRVGTVSIWIRFLLPIGCPRVHFAAGERKSYKNLLRKGRQDVVERRVVAKGSTHVREAVDVPGTEDETAAELEWVFTELVLLVSGGLGALAPCCVVRAQQMQQVCFF